MPSSGKTQPPRHVSQLQNTLVRNTLASWIHYGSAIASSFVLTPLIISKISAPAYGVLVLLNQLMGYAGVLDMGLQPALVKYTAEIRAVGDRKRLRVLVSTALALQLVIGLAVVAIVSAIRPHLGVWFHLEGVTTSEATRAFLLFGLGAALGFPASVFSGVLKGYNRFDQVAWVGVATQCVRAFGTIAALYLDQGVVGLAWVGLIANAVSYISCLLLALTQTNWLTLRPSLVSRELLRPLFSFGFFSLVGSAGWYLANGTDAVVIATFLTSSDVAHLGIVLSVLAVLSGVVGAFPGTLMPAASEFQARGELQKTQDAYLMATRVSLFLACPAVAFLVLWGPQLIAAWVGQELARATAPLLRILAIAHLVMLMNAPAIPIALGLGRHRKAALLTFCEGIANIVLSCFLVTRLGVRGVAFGTLFPALFVHGLLYPRVMCSVLNLDGRRFLRETVMASSPRIIALVSANAFLRWHEDAQTPTSIIPMLSALSLWAMALLYKTPVIPSVYRALYPHEPPADHANLES